MRGMWSIFVRRDEGLSVFSDVLIWKLMKVMESFASGDVNLAVKVRILSFGTSDGYTQKS